MFAFVGAVVAAALFFGVLILGSRANTPHPRANLLIPVPPPPILPSPTPGIKIVLPTPTVALPVASAEEATASGLPVEIPLPQ